MGFQSIFRFGKKVALRILVILIVGLSEFQGYSQVKFAVSSENGHSVISNFTDDTLNDALSNGTIAVKDVLRIYLGDRGKPASIDRPAILGTYKFNSGRIIFEPLIPFTESLNYTAVFGDSIEYSFRVTPVANPLTTLLEIYPTTDSVPANLLKIYLKFSGPMREGEVYKRVNIYRKDGTVVKNPFVPLQPELWNESGNVVTLWLDPGRVKRALGSRETYGPILEESFEYILIVDSLWQDANGQKLPFSYSKSFEVGPEDRVKPQVSTMQMTLPAAFSREPLIVKFGTSLDFATAQHAFSVSSPNKEVLNGSMELIESESMWRFIPETSWEPDNYKVFIYSKLEDLAGNNLNRVFDRDINADQLPPSDQEFHWIDFEVSLAK